MTSEYSGDEMAGAARRIARFALRPASEWRAIDAAPIGLAAIVAVWVLPFAAIRPLARLIGQLVFGLAGWGPGWRPSVALLASKALIGFASNVLGLMLLALILAAIAPLFGGERSLMRAAKLMAFSAVPVGLAGVFALYPPLAIFEILGLYGAYLFWTGLPILLRIPADRVSALFATMFVVAFVVWIASGAIAGAMFVPAVPSIDLG